MPSVYPIISTKNSLQKAGMKQISNQIQGWEKHKKYLLSFPMGQEHRNKTSRHKRLKSSTGSDKTHFNLDKFLINGRGDMSEGMI